MLLPALLYVAFGFLSCANASCSPEITYGEFPFRIEYEIHGERVIIEDTIICKFDGFNLNWDTADKTRRWKIYFASGRESGARNLADLKINENDQIYFSLGNPDYYMGEEGGYFGFRAFKLNNGVGINYPTIEPDELYDTYGIKVISYEFSDPIVNTFK